MVDRKTEMKELVVVIPIYRESLLVNELKAIDSYCSYFNDYDLFFVCSQSLNVERTQKKYPQIQYKRFKDEYFVSNKSYNALMFDISFYESFAGYKYLLIAQTDAIIYNPHKKIEEFMQLDMDYIGAPWYVSPIQTEGVFKYFIKRLIIHDSLALQCGNGGFSMRKTSFCIELLKQTRLYRKIVWHFNEDLFFSYVGKKRGFYIADIEIGKSFCLEQKMKEMLLTGEKPLALHAWEKEFETYADLEKINKV